MTQLFLKEQSPAGRDAKGDKPSADLVPVKEVKGPQAKSQALVKAITKNDLELVKQSIAEDTPLGMDSTGITPLYLAAKLGHLEIVKLILATEQGLETIELAPAKGDTPLVIAARKKNVEVMKALLSATAEGRLVLECHQFITSSKIVDGYLLIPLYLRSEEDYEIVMSEIRKMPYQELEATKSIRPELDLLDPEKLFNRITAELPLFIREPDQLRAKKQEYGIILYRVVKIMVYLDNLAFRHTLSGEHGYKLWKKFRTLAKTYNELAQLLVQAEASLSDAMSCLAHEHFDSRLVTRSKLIEIVLKYYPRKLQPRDDAIKELFKNPLVRDGTSVLWRRDIAIGDMLKQPDENGATPVWIAAAEDRSPYRLEALLKFPEGCEALGQTNIFGITPLLIAASRGNIQAVQKILDKPEGLASVLVARSSKRRFVDYDNGGIRGAARYPETSIMSYGLWQHDVTPLWVAAANGHYEVVKLLLDTVQGLSTLDQPDARGITPLLIAAYRGFSAVVGLLWAKSNSRGFFSFSLKHKELVDLLIEHQRVWLRKGKDKYDQLRYDSEDEDTSFSPFQEFGTPLHSAAHEGNSALVLALIKTSLGRSSIKFRSNFLETPLYAAAKNGHLDVVRILLATEEGRETVLQIKSYELSEKARSSLGVSDLVSLESDNDDEQRRKLPHYPLPVAVSKGQIAIVEELLKWPEGRASIKTRQVFTKKTPLIIAILKRQSRIVMALLNTAEGRETADWCLEDDRSALFLAVEWGQPEVVKRLLNIPEARLTVNKAARSGRTPLWLAASKGNIELGALLLSYGADLREVRGLALKAKNEKVLKGLAEIEKYYGLMFPPPSDYISTAMDEEQLAAIDESRQLIKAILTQIYNQLMVSQRGLMHSKTENRMAKATGMFFALIFYILPGPGFGLAGRAVEYGVGEAVSLAVRKTAASRDKTKAKYIGEGIETLDQAAEQMLALTNALLYRFQLIFANLHKNSRPIFIAAVIKAMIEYWERMSEKLESKGLDKALVGTGLIHVDALPSHIPPLPDDPKTRFSHIVKNMVMGTALWKSREPGDVKRSVVTPPVDQGYLAQLRDAVTGDPSVYLKTPKGYIEVTVRSLCQDSPVVVWAGEKDREEFFWNFHKQSGADNPLTEMLPPRFLSLEEAELLGYRPLSAAIIKALPIHPHDLEKEKSQEKELLAAREAELAAKKELAAKTAELAAKEAELAAEKTRSAELEKELAQLKSEEGSKDKTHRADSRTPFNASVRSTSTHTPASFFAFAATEVPSAVGAPPPKKPENKSSWRPQA